IFYIFFQVFQLFSNCSCGRQRIRFTFNLKPCNIMDFFLLWFKGLRSHKCRCNANYYLKLPNTPKTNKRKNTDVVVYIDFIIRFAQHKMLQKCPAPKIT
uniref:Uncharacterized protein n=1 Tax=Glossina palpalis gambiensis TaxID=67801 RepID=A0A1B0BFI5_9MUSC